MLGLQEYAISLIGTLFSIAVHSSTVILIQILSTISQNTVFTMYSRILSNTGHCVMFNGVGGGLVSVYEKTKFQSGPKRRGAGLGGERRRWGTWPRLGKTLKADNVPLASCR